MSKPNPLVQSSIAALITPTSEFDTFATHHFFYAQGGFKKSADSVERLAITTARREADLTFVLQVDTGHWWSLEGGVDNSNWVDKGTNSPLDSVSDAANTTYDNADSNLVATNVKTALDELDSAKAEADHNHNDQYYTETEVDDLISDFAEKTTNNTFSGDNEFVGDLIGKRPTYATTITASQALVLAMRNTLVRASHATTEIELEVPANATVAFAIDTEIEVLRENDADVTFTAEGGVTLYASYDLYSIEAKYEVVILKKIDTDIWLLTGARK